MKHDHLCHFDHTCCAAQCFLNLPFKSSSVCVILISSGISFHNTLPEYDIIFLEILGISSGDEKIITSDRSFLTGVYIIYFIENGVSSFRMHIIEFL